MRFLTLVGVSTVCALLLGTAGPRAAACDPIGNVRFVCDQVGPEDLLLVPGGEWVVSSGMAANGAIRLISVRDKTTTVLFPTESPRVRPDTRTYNSCPGPIDLSDRNKFRAHGLYLRPGRSSVHTLYLVHHGTRESIEIFEFDGRAKPPVLTWIGCAIAPEPIGLYSVVGLADGGFVTGHPKGTGERSQGVGVVIHEKEMRFLRHGDFACGAVHPSFATVALAASSASVFFSSTAGFKTTPDCRCGKSIRKVVPRSSSLETEIVP